MTLPAAPIRALACLVFLPLGACTPDDSKLDETGQPDDAVWQVDEQRLLDHVQTLSSDEYEGRGTGQDGGELATQYVEAHYSALGLAPAGDAGSYRAGFPVTVFEELAPPELSLAGNPQTRVEDFEMFSGSGSGDVTAEVVYAGYGITVPAFDPAVWPRCPLDPAGYDDYAAVDVAGKIALVMRHGPNDDESIYNYCPANEVAYDDDALWLFGYKAANAALHGAAAMLLFTDFNHSDSAPSTGSIGDAYFTEDLPALWVDRDVLLADLPELQAWQDSIDTTLQPASQATGVEARVFASTAFQTSTVYNVQALIEGDDRADEVVIVGAHFDHLGITSDGTIYPGADDNASGTAAVLEMATVLADALPSPSRTILFLNFNAEEWGLYGSEAYVMDPLFPLADTVAMINLDMVGGGDETGVFVFGGTDDNQEWLVDLMEAVNPAGEDFPIIPLGPSPNSDHAYFYAAGVPAVMLFTAGDHPIYHTPADTFDTISGYELRSTTDLALATIKGLAMAREDELGQQLTPSAAPPIAPPVDLSRFEPNTR